MTLQLTTESNQYSLRIPAHRYWQGQRCVYYFPLDLATLDGLLPQRVDESVIRDANRRLTLTHAKEIKDYLNRTKEWLLGTFLLGISSDAVEFHPYMDAEGNKNIYFGELRILTNRQNTMRIFDGQHRRRAISDLLGELIEDARSSEQLSTFRNAAIPIVLYEEADIRSLRQMFNDAAKAKPIEASTSVRFDQRDPISLAAQWLSENSDLFKGRVELEGTTAGGSNHNLLAINQLARTLRTLLVGYTRRVTRRLNDEFVRDQDKLNRLCKVWADEFLPAARDEYRQLAGNLIGSSEIPQWRRMSLAFNIATLQVLAGCYHVWTSESRDWKQLANFINSSDLNVGGATGSLMVEAGAIAPGESYPVARRQEVQGAINHIVAQAKNYVP